MNSIKINLLLFFQYGQKDRGPVTPESLQGERRRDLLSFPSLSAFLFSQNNIILTESRHYSTSFCFPSFCLLNVNVDLNGHPDYISVSLSPLKSSSVSHNHVVTVNAASFYFHFQI